jgi:phage replication-related protein YjqB (UPF0714/DUF867 family)
MMRLSRRSVLAVLGGAAAGPAMSGGFAAAAGDLKESNTDLYGDPAFVAGVDYGLRYRRHAAADDSETLTSGPFPDTAVIAPHGGGIEPGTSELCLAVAGYHPATMTVTPAAGPVYDFWMFEGLRSSNNSQLHITSTHCDDPVARSICAGARRAVSLHGCTPSQARVAEGVGAVLVGGADTGLRALLMARLTDAGVYAIDAAGVGELDGDNPDNIVNGTLGTGGAQLELTTPLRAAMFTTNTRSGRRTSTTPAFWQFAGAVRSALAA